MRVYKVMDVDSGEFMDRGRYPSCNNVGMIIRSKGGASCKLNTYLKHYSSGSPAFKYRRLTIIAYFLSEVERSPIKVGKIFEKD